MPKSRSTSSGTSNRATTNLMPTGARTTSSTGLANKVVVTYGRRRHGKKPIKETKPVNRTLEQIRTEQRAVAREIAALSFTQRQQILFADKLISAANRVDDANHMDAMDTSPDGPTFAQEFNDDDDDNWSDDEILAQHTLPPGEEGFHRSHAGGEAQLHSLLDGLSSSKRVDSRTRKNRIKELVEAWRKQTPLLAKQYLDWKLNTDLELPAQGRPPPGREPSMTEEGDGTWSIDVISFSYNGPRIVRSLPGTSYLNESLVRQGLLGATPELPKLAFDINLLAIYRQLRRVCPRFSIDALAKALCHIHGRPRHPHLADQLSSAYDSYLEIQRKIAQMSQEALNRPPDWDHKNVCAPCLYKVDNEPPLKYSFLAAMDGNNFLKLVDSTFRSGTTRLDPRQIDSGRWISPEEVDRFKDEVGKKPASSDAPPSNSASPSGNMSTTPSTSSSDDPPATQSTPSQDQTAIPDADTEDLAWLNVTEMDELAQCLNACVERWRNAGPDAKKKMFALFAVAGIFLAVCRHGHVLVICDMIRSGELMKYPLAVVNRLVETYGPDICLGYDIMCAFIKTLSRSCLGEKKVAFRLNGVVPSFHGHAHNRTCQLYWHPMYMEGVGTEDFEECERTFSKSNELASVTRLCTPFHRHQHITEHFAFHDQDKHASSGNFIYQNYRQALERIDTDVPKLEALQIVLGTSESDYEEYLRAERKYLEDLKSEPPEVAFTVDYMELLAKWHSAKSESDTTATDLKNLDYLIIRKGYTKKKITNLKTRYRTTFTWYALREEELTRFEEEHNVVTRWAPESEEYKNAKKLLNERTYRRAVDHLERLVVQRLFELTKLGMSGVGYKLREKIGKALKTRSEAIKSALKQYNEAAEALTPPREPLTWSKVLQAVTVADFDLLRDTRHDIKSLPWAEPSRREATSLYFGIKRAREEIVRLNVEITRLLTFMLDSHVEYYHAIRTHIFTDPPLAHQLSTQWEHLNRVHEAIAQRLQQASGLRGFSGALCISNRISRSPDLRKDVPYPSWAKALHLDQQQRGRRQDMEQDGETTQPNGPEQSSSSTAHEVNEQEDDEPPRELDVDTGLVIQLIEKLSTSEPV